MTASVKQPPKLKKSPSKNSLKPKSLAAVLGADGEARASLFLIARGYLILDRNVRAGGGELDLVAWDNAHCELVFIEVKTRHQNFSGNPASAVNFRKQRAVRRAVHAYLHEIWPTRRVTHQLTTVPLPVDYRIDVVAIWPGHIAQYQNISW